MPRSARPSTGSAKTTHRPKSPAPAEGARSREAESAETTRRQKGMATASAEATRRRPSSGSYIYGIVPADVEVSSDATGVGNPPGRVTLLRHGEIAALLSEVDFDRPLGTPGDLVAHEALLDATVAEVPVLPLRFGAVMTDPDSVVGELLAPHHDEFRAALDELEGRAEYVVKGRYAEETVLREVLTENPEAARLRDDVRGMPEEVTRNERIRLGELINQAVTAKREADTQALIDCISPFCVLTAVREPTHEWDAVHLAVLLDLDREKELTEAVREFGRHRTGRIDLRLLGPLAPYDFVMAAGLGEV
jgi:hypothetical protein